jgi:hypothetical protein
LQKYCGTSGRTNATGVSSTDEAATNRRKHDAELAHNRRVAQGFREFWDKAERRIATFRPPLIAISRLCGARAEWQPFTRLARAFI